MNSEERAEGSSEGRFCNPLVVPALLTVFSIALAVVTAGYMGGFTLMNLECGEVSLFDHNCSKDPYGNWEVSVLVKNIDDDVFILSGIYVNGVEASSYDSEAPESAVGSITTGFPSKGKIEAGETYKAVLWIGSMFKSFHRGDSIEFRIQGLDGRSYTIELRLP